MRYAELGFSAFKNLEQADRRSSLDWVPANPVVLFGYFAWYCIVAIEKEERQGVSPQSQFTTLAFMLLLHGLNN